MYDCHLHTEFSYDGQTTIRAICELSLRHGMRGICLTDHLELRPNEPERQHIPDHAARRRSFEQALAEYGDRLEMTCGLELGLDDGIQAANQMEILLAKPDFIIGSVHYVDGCEVYTGDYSYGKSREQAYLGYLETVLRQVRQHDYFDVLGHLDMILRDRYYGNRCFDRAEFNLLVDDILRELIDSGRGIEVNSSGWSYGLDGPHPGADILRRYRQLGGRIITTGSDSHRANSVNRDIDAATLLLRELGYTEVSYFRGRKAESRQI